MKKEKLPFADEVYSIYCYETTDFFCYLKLL